MTSGSPHCNIRLVPTLPASQVRFQRQFAVAGGATSRRTVIAAAYVEVAMVGVAVVTSHLHDCPARAAAVRVPALCSASRTHEPRGPA